MDITKYYQKAKAIGDLPELEGTTESRGILEALDYDRMDDHPSNWVPKVQKSLLECFKAFPEKAFSSELLELYVQGQIMDDNSELNTTVKVGFFCVILGLSLGWFLWA